MPFLHKSSRYRSGRSGQSGKNIAESERKWAESAQAPGTGFDAGWKLGRNLTPLADRLVTAQGGGVRQVETPYLGPHGDTQASVGVCQHLTGKSCRFAAKDQHCSRLEFRLQVAAGSLLGEVPVLVHRQPLDQLGPILDDLQVQELPVVEASTTDRGVVDVEAQRFYQPKLGSHGDTGAADVARVVVDLRLVEDDVEIGFVRHRRLTTKTQRAPRNVIQRVPSMSEQSHIGYACFSAWCP